jgi:hypothetical protein
MSLISQNIIDHYSELDEYGEMSFMFGRFADAHPREYLLVFNAFYTALRNGEVNCYHEGCDHSPCPVWAYYLEWFMHPMMEQARNNNNVANQVQEIVQVFQQALPDEVAELREYLQYGM